MEKLIVSMYEYGITTNDISELTCVDIKDVRSITRRARYAGVKRKYGVTPYEQVKMRRRKLKLMAVLYRGGKCSKCGYSHNLSALDFHHRNPEEKEFNISAANKIGWQEIKTEADKCDLLCANCHREVHNLDNHANEILEWWSEQDSNL